MKNTSVNLSLRLPVSDALATDAEQAGLDLSDHIARILEDYVIASGLLDDEARRDILLSRSLIDRAVDEALRLAQDGRPLTSITPDAIASVCRDETWLGDYRTLVRDDPYKTGNPRKQTINQNLGYFIKKALGAESVTKPDGKPANVKVTGAIIQSYTPLAKQP